MTDAQTLTLTIPRRLILSSNDRRHYHDARRRVAELRALAAYTARSLQLRPMPAATVDVAIAYPDRRRRDAPNLWPTVKPLLDGIVTDAGILPDDDDEHIPSLTFRRSRLACPAGVVIIELTFNAADVVDSLPSPA
jgi:crossover junction endodeoxyribonuclease RusA